MSSGLYSGVSGLALGSGLYRNVSGLWGGSSGLINGFGGSGPFPGASLYLDFLTPPLDSRITFSRGTNATLVDSTGKIAYAPANLLLQSQTIATAPWSGDTSGGSIPTATNDAGIAPDGTNTATRLQINRGAGIYSRWQQTGAAGPTGFYLSSVWMRTTSGTGTANVGLRNDATGVNCVVTGTWQRFSVINATAINFSNIQILSFTSIPGTDVSADILVWGAQSEPVTYQTTPGPYVATTASPYYGPRFDYDPVTLAPRGLLIEEARTNLILRSEEFNSASWLSFAALVSADVTAAPSGVTVADKITEAAGAANQSVYNGNTAPFSTVTASTYFKSSERTFAHLSVSGGGSAQWFAATFNLTTGVVTQQLAGASGTISGATITNAGNGWYRCTVTGITGASTASTFVYCGPSTTATPTPGSFGVLAYSGTAGSGIFAWGAQLEAGAFATSYIPTVASTVTRNADVAQMTGTNFSSWFNSARGTFVASVGSGANGRCVLVASDNSVTNQLIMVSTADNIFAVYTGGSYQAMLGVTPAAPFASTGAYATNDFAACANGGTVATDTSGSLAASYTQMSIGSNYNGSGVFLNGLIRAIAYYNTRLPNTQLQTLTAPSLASPLALDFLSTSYTVGY